MANVYLNDLHSMTVTVKVTRQFYWRMWVGLKLLELSARIMRCGFQVQEGNE